MIHLIKKIPVLLATFFLIFITLTQNVNGAIVKQETNNDGIKTYYVTSQEENDIVLNLIKYNMESMVHVVYSGDMIPKSKSSLKSYYMLNAIKSLNQFNDKVLVFSGNIAVYKGFGIKDVEYNSKDNTATVIYEFRYYDTPKEARQVENKINSAIKENAAELKTDYQKAKWAYQWILDNVKSDKLLENMSAYSGLFGNGTVCVGYATLYCALVSKLGIPCRYIEGTVYESKESHAWNIIKIDGKWYCVDATWGENNPDKYFLKSIETFASKEYGYHFSDIYANYQTAGEVFSSEDYRDTDELSVSWLLPSVYNIKMDNLQYNILQKNETYHFMISNPDKINIEFRSTNVKVATVDKNGVVTAIGKGEASILAYNKKLNIRQVCKIKVI